MAARPIQPNLAVAEVLRILNDQIEDPRQKIVLPRNVFCSKCSRRAVVRVCMDRKSKDHENYGRIYGICFNEDGHYGQKTNIDWLTDPLEAEVRWALRESMKETVPAWSSSPIKDNRPSKRARLARDGAGNRYLNCTACGKGRAAQACEKGWCKKCCHDRSVCTEWNKSFGCAYHGRSPGGGMNGVGGEMVDARGELQVADSAENGASAAPGGAGVFNEPPSTQAFHGATRIGRRLDDKYDQYRQEEKRAEEARRREEKEARERAEMLARVFSLVVFTKTEKHQFAIHAQSCHLTGSLTTRSIDWPKRVVDLLFAEEGEEMEEVFIYETDSRSWVSYDCTTYRKVERGERLLVRLPGVSSKQQDVLDEIHRVAPETFRDARRGAKQTPPHLGPKPLSPTPFCPTPHKPGRCPSSTHTPVSQQKHKGSLFPMASKRRRSARSPSPTLTELDFTRDSSSPDIIFPTIERSEAAGPPLTPSRRPVEAADFEAVPPIGASPASSSLPPSSPPIPLAEILTNAWPGSRSFQTICGAFANIDHLQKHERKGPDDAFREFYGFEKPFPTWAQHRGYLRHPSLKPLVNKYKQQPQLLWKDFAKEARKQLKKERAERKQQERTEMAGQGREESEEVEEVFLF